MAEDITTEPLKKRGRTKKVVEDLTEVVKGRKGVKPASTKIASAKTATAKTVTVQDTKTPKTKPSPAIPSSTKSTAAKTSTPKITIPKSTTTKTSTTKAAVTKAKSVPLTPKAPNKVAVEPPKPIVQTTPVTPTRSKILEEVYAKGTLKGPVVNKNQTSETAQSLVSERKNASGEVAPAAKAQAEPQKPPQKPPAIPATGAIPTSDKQKTKPIIPSAPPPSSPPPATPPLPKMTPPKPLPKFQTQPPTASRPSTIPLPTHPKTPFTLATPAPTRPKPPPTPSPAELEKQQIERDISEGRMPKKYKPAARRVTTIIVGIPIIIVMGYELWKRYDTELGVRDNITEMISSPAPSMPTPRVRNEE